jgi:hypothetical protein
MRSRVTLAVLAFAILAAPAWAEDHDFKATAIYRLTSLTPMGDQLLIVAEGGGVSRILGPFTATATVTQDAVPDPCFAYSAESELISSQGTLHLHSDGSVCAQPDMITGAWYVVGGTGAFAGATGSGVEQGKQSFVGSDPVVDHLDGTLSY